MSHDPNAHARGRSEPIELESRAVGQTHAIGRAIAGLCRSGDVVALEGDLGAGKTQLVRGLATGLGLDPDEVSSPTFVFVHAFVPAAPAAARFTLPLGLTLANCHAAALPRANLSLTALAA